MNKNAKKYFYTLRHKIPYVPKMKTAYLSSIRLSIVSYLKENPVATMTDLTNEIGTINDLCEAYKDELSSEQLTFKFRKNKILRLCIILLTLLIIICTISYIWYRIAHLPGSFTTTIRIGK